MSQTQKILKYLESGATITPIEAYEKFKCMRLAARIGDINEMGYTILSEMIYKKDKTKYARYRLIAKAAKFEYQNNQAGQDIFTMR